MLRLSLYDYFPLAEPYEPPPPVADAGPDIVVDENTTVQFNATNSSDDAGIVNYTWKFDYEGDKVELYGPTPNYRFEEPRTYDIQL